MDVLGPVCLAPARGARTEAVAPASMPEGTRASAERRRPRGQAGRPLLSLTEGRHAAGRAAGCVGLCLRGTPAPHRLRTFLSGLRVCYRGLVMTGKKLSTILLRCPPFFVSCRRAERQSTGKGTAFVSVRSQRSLWGVTLGRHLLPGGPWEDRARKSGCLEAGGSWTLAPTGFSFPSRTSSRDTC